MTTRRLLILFTLLASLSHASPPPGILNMQGRIAVNGSNFGSPAPQTGYFKFALIDDGATETLWTNDDSMTGTPGGQPSAAVPVTVSNGHYSLGLGDTALTNMSSPVPASLFENNDEVFLRIWFSTASGGPFELLTPDRRLNSAPYALHAAKADGVIDGNITSAMLAAGSVTTGKLAGGAVTAANLADGAVSGLDSIDGLITDVLRVAENGLTAADSDGTNLDWPRAIAVQGDFAYVVDSGSDLLQIFDISDPDNIVARDNDGTNMQYPGSVVVQGNFAYVVDFTTDLLQIFDVSDPDNIVARDSDGTNLAAPQAIAVQGSFAYVVDSSSDLLQIFDVSDPNNIVSRGSAATMLGPSSVAVRGAIAYVAGRDPVSGLTLGEFQIFDVSDPDNIVLRDSEGTNLFTPEAVVIQGDFAYIVDSFVLQIFDISNPDNIVPRGSQSTTPANYQAGTVDGNYAYVLDSALDVLQIFDISNPDSIVIGDSDGTNLHTPTAVAVQGEFAYVVDSFNDLLQIFALVPEVRTDRNLEVVGARVGIGTNAPVTDLHVAGDAFVTGSLLDSSQAAGTAGQALLSTGAGTAWSNLLDDDPANELQTLSLVDTTITLSNGGGSIDIVDAGADADPDPTNELQSLSLLGTNLTLSDGGGTVSINDPDADPTNEFQTLRLTGSDLELSSGGGTISINDADADPSNELQSLDLSANDLLTLTNGGSANLARFLRSSVTDSYSKGTLTFASDSTLQVEGDLLVEHSDGIKFNGGAESIKWLDATDSFITTAGLWVQAPFRAGGQVGFFWDFHSFAIGGGLPGSSAMLDQNDLWIEGNLEVGSGLYLSGNLRMNTAESDQFLYFYEDASATGESLKWDNASDRFEFSDNVSISSSGNTSQLRLEQTSASNFARLELATTDGGLWRIAAQGGAAGDLRFYNGARDRMILEDNGDLNIDGVLSQGSDRNRKENIVPVDPAEVLEQVAALPITRWIYKDDVAATPHLGPMSQDFHAAFGVGDDERRIPAIDADGVALAAIQGLNTKVETLETENTALRARLERLENALNALSNFDAGK